MPRLDSRIGLINYGAGNFTSVRNALEHLQLDFVEVDRPSQMDLVDRLVLPGVGAFAAAMRKLEMLSLVEHLRHQVTEECKPFLGICVGMQILAEIGHEFEVCRGLGLVEGAVEMIPAAEVELPVPHMGWNELTIERTCSLFAGMPKNPAFYFVHSFQLNPTDSQAIIATSEYGGPITACVQKANIFGVQFHPEKSQRDGLQLLKNFAEM